MAERVSRKADNKYAHLFANAIFGTDNQPVTGVEWIDRNELDPNDWNPNHVAPPELELLKISLLSDGWTQPIVARTDGTIVDGFHRWTVAADPEIGAMTDGLVPVVRIRTDLGVDHQMGSTIRHNRARGTHRVVEMSGIVNTLLEDHGLTDEQVGQLLGMEHEEIKRFREAGNMPRMIGGDRNGFSSGWTVGDKS